MELLGDLDPGAVPGSRGDDRVGRAQIAGDRRLEEHVQPRLDRTQSDFAVRSAADADDADLRLGLPNESVEIRVPRHAQTLTELPRGAFASAPDRDQLHLVRQDGQKTAVHVRGPGAGADDGDSQRPSGGDCISHSALSSPSGRRPAGRGKALPVPVSGLPPVSVSRGNLPDKTSGPGRETRTA